MTRAQSRALEHLSPQYLLPLPDGAIGQAFWAASVKRSAPLAIEIGFGNGGALAKLAHTHPDWNCVGVDVYLPGFGALMLACERDGIENVRIVDTEALALLRRLEAASVHLINVFFPDPWPKARHHKRRLVNSDFAHSGCRLPRARGGVVPRDGLDPVRGADAGGARGRA